MHNPFFSIIIPTFNSGREISDALRSIINQEWNDFEVLVIDAVSSDHTIQIVREFEDRDSRIRHISEKDEGIYDAMNKGVRMAKGKWLYFLGANDILADNYVLNEIAGKLKYASVNFVYGNVLLQPGGKIYGKEFTEERLLFENISHQAIFYNADFFRIVGAYKKEYRTHADWDFNLKCFNSGLCKPLYLKRTIAFFQEGGASRNHDRVFLREVLLMVHVKRIMQKPSLLNSILYFDFVWRILRNAGIRDVNSTPGAKLWPKQVQLMLSFQKVIPTSMLAKGLISKFFMFAVYLRCQFIVTR